MKHIIALFLMIAVSTPGINAAPATSSSKIKKNKNSTGRNKKRTKGKNKKNNRKAKSRSKLSWEKSAPPSSGTSAAPASASSSPAAAVIHPLKKYRTITIEKYQPNVNSIFSEGNRSSSTILLDKPIQAATAVDQKQTGVETGAKDLLLTKGKGSAKAPPAKKQTMSRRDNAVLVKNQQGNVWVSHNAPKNAPKIEAEQMLKIQALQKTQAAQQKLAIQAPQTSAPQSEAQRKPILSNRTEVVIDMDSDKLKGIGVSKEAPTSPPSSDIKPNTKVNTNEEGLGATSNNVTGLDKTSAAKTVREFMEMPQAKRYDAYTKLTTEEKQKLTAGLSREARSALARPVAPQPQYLNENGKKDNLKGAEMKNNPKNNEKPRDLKVNTNSAPEVQAQGTNPQGPTTELTMAQQLQAASQKLKPAPPEKTDKQQGLELAEQLQEQQAKLKPAFDLPKLKLDLHNLNKEVEKAIEDLLPEAREKVWERKKSFLQKKYDLDLKDTTMEEYYKENKENKDRLEQEARDLAYEMWKKANNAKYTQLINAEKAVKRAEEEAERADEARQRADEAKNRAAELQKRKDEAKKMEAEWEAEWEAKLKTLQETDVEDLLKKLNEMNLQDLTNVFSRFPINDYNKFKGVNQNQKDLLLTLFAKFQFQAEKNPNDLMMRSKCQEWQKHLRSLGFTNGKLADAKKAEAEKAEIKMSKWEKASQITGKLNEALNRRNGPKINTTESDDSFSESDQSD